MPSLTDHVAVKPNVIFRSLGGEAVILNLDSGMYFGLDEVGSRVWQLLESRAVSEVCDQLAAEYDAGLEQIRRDVLALVTALESKGLVECRIS